MNKGPWKTIGAILSLLAMLGGVVYAATRPIEQRLGSAEADIKEIREKAETDRQLLIRIDERVRDIHLRLK